MHTWYVPCHSGDYRLEAHVSGTFSTLTIEKPTVTELAVLKLFTAEAYSKGWLKAIPKISKRTKRTVELTVPIEVATPSLLAHAHKENTPLWTGAKSSAGTVTLLPHVPQDTSVAIPKDTEVAATVRSPYRGCPPPVECNPRASEVLHTFLSPRQSRDWEREGRMTVNGGISGRRYSIYHRGVAAKMGLDHTIVDDQGYTLCAYNPLLPAEEEALGLKWMLEHDEHTVMGLDVKLRAKRIGGGRVNLRRAPRLR